MIITNAGNAGHFVYRSTAIGPNEALRRLNDGDGDFHQWTYIIEGIATYTVKDSDGNVLESDSSNREGQLVDHSSSKGKYQYITTEERGLSTISFNPIPMSRNLSVEILKEGSYTITTTDTRKTIVGITGEVFANDKKINNSNHAKVLPNKSVTLVVPTNSICAIVAG